MDTLSESPAKVTHALVRLSLYMILISALVRLGASLYLPALPSMSDDLNLSASDISFTMTVYLIAFAAASILFGPLSDHWGRRILIQGGIALYLVGSVLCAFAQGFETLIAGRIVQAAGGSAIPVAIRAMAREAYDDEGMISVLGWVGAVSSLVPILAPVLGGLLTQTWGWRINFHLLAAVTLLMGLYAVRNTPETLSEANRTPFDIVDTLRTYGSMSVTPAFIVPVIPILLCFAAQGAYLVGAPFIFVDLLGMKPAAFGATSLVLVGALFIGRSACMALFKRHGAYPVYLAGGVPAFLGGLFFLCILWTGRISIVSILESSALFFLGFGVLVPISMKAGLSVFPKRTGTSSALFGCLTLSATAAGSALLGAFLNKTPRDIDFLGLFIFAAGTLILLSVPFCRRALEEDFKRNRSSQAPAAD